MNSRQLMIAFALIAGTPQQGWATCFPEVDYSVRSEFDRADIVALARAESVTWLDENRKPTKLRQPLTFGSIPGGLDPYIGAYYSLRLVKSFKGNPPARFRIFSENSTARTPLPALLVVSLLTGFAVSCERRDEKLAADHPSVRPGTSKEEAIAVLGTPSWEGKCDSKGITPLKAGCASELGYSSWLAPLKPVYRVVQLDDRARVISSDFVASP